MIGSVEAVGQKTRAQRAKDVMAVADIMAADGESGMAEQAVTAKSSLTITPGRRNRASSVIEKGKPRQVQQDEQLRHNDPTLIPGDVLREELGGVPKTV